MLRPIAAALAAAGLLLLTASPAATAADEPLEYVALGDSYSAGFGLLPVASDEPASGCYQAEANYPHRVAAALGLQLNDRTCSGAVTANIRDTEQTTITGAGVAPVQSDALSASTDIVTVTIGGNDLGFSTVAAACVSLDADGPALGHPGFENCKAFYNPTPDVDQLLFQLQYTVAPALNETFELIRQKAPNARVFVIGYPTIAPSFDEIPMPQPPGCFVAPADGSGYVQNSFPYQQVDTLYLHHIEDQLDQAIQTAAQAHGFTFVPTWDATRQHSACSSEPYIFGITLTNDASDGTPTPVSGLYVELGALHPNDAGVAFLTGQVAEAIRGGALGEEEPPNPQLAATGASLIPVGAGVLLLIAGAAVLTIRRRARV